MSEQTTPEVQEQAPEQVTLQLQDILAAAQCIQLASTRGAFRAEEFTQVGGIYERLVSFLQASGALTPPAGEQPASPTEAPAAQ
jgi:hypothetical protein